MRSELRTSACSERFAVHDAHHHKSPYAHPYQGPYEAAVEDIADSESWSDGHGGCRCSAAVDLQNLQPDGPDSVRFQRNSLESACGVVYQGAPISHGEMAERSKAPD